MELINIYWLEPHPKMASNFDSSNQILALRAYLMPVIESVKGMEPEFKIEVIDKNLRF